MDRQQTEAALKNFEKAFALDPQLYVARLNQGIALANLQRADAARAILVEASEKIPQDAHAWYNLGLLEKSQGNAKEALAAFERARAIDPNDPEIFFFIGQIHQQLQQYDKAIEAFQKSLALNPFEVSAEFGLAQAYQRSGNTAQSREHLARFQHITAEKLGKPMSLIYGEQGKYSLAEEFAGGTESPGPPIAVHFTSVKSSGLPSRMPASPAVPLALEEGQYHGAGVCVLDYDGDGQADLFLTEEDGSGRAALYHNLGNGRFEDVTAKSGIRGNAVACAVGDFDNDGKPDLAVSFGRVIPFTDYQLAGVALFHNEGNGKFRDVSSTTGLRVPGAAMGMTFVDFDHDGDLDLYLTGVREQIQGDPLPPLYRVSNQLWRNNGNGTFTNWTKETGLEEPEGSVAAIPSDINNDRAIDLVVTDDNTVPWIYFNPREGEFRAAQPWPNSMPNGTRGVVALDFNKDGWMDLAFTHPVAPGLTLWRNVDGKSFEQVKLPELGLARAWGVVALDYDNDGWIDLAAVGEGKDGRGRIVLLRNEGAAGFRDVTAETELDKIKLLNPRGLVAFDYDGDGATDLLITQAGGPPVLLRNVGGAKNNWLRIGLKGLNDNKSGFGTKVEVFAGEMKQKWEYTGAGYLGQSAADLVVGLGAESQADVVRLLWPTGVPQDEVNLPARTRQEITELDRRGSSCPIVFVWNGKKFEFLADMIGPGIVGHWIGPNQRNVPDPEEYLKVAGSHVQPLDGRIRFRMLEPMEELDYLDRVRLLAVDHPADVEVYPNEYFASNPPFPEFKVIASRAAHPLAGAWDDAGRDVLSLLRARDRHYVTDFPSEPFQGIAKMHSLTLDLGPWDPSRPLRLLMDGFTDYFTANSMYAAWQAGIQPVAPYVEAQLADGSWQRVVNDMGFPAGLARTMVADLTGKLPPGTRRIRITTNLKVYWDRIRVDNSAADIPYKLTELPLAGARLRFRGYPRVIEGHPRNDLIYVYEEVSRTGPYTRQMGNYTRYGDVKALLEKTDEQYVIFGSGDEVAADFDATRAPAVPGAWTRDYFFYADGFAKDMDFYAAHGETVDPLPFHTLIPYPYPPGISYPFDDSHRRYELEYNTRGVAGPVGGSFQFRYPEKAQQSGASSQERRAGK